MLRLIAAILVIDFADLVRRDVARRRLQAVSAFAALAALTIVLATLMRSLGDEQRESESRRLATASAQAADPEDALRLAIQAMDARVTLEAEQAISQATENQHARAVLHHGSPVFRIEFSADGRSLLSGGDHGAAALWDVAGGSLRVRLRGLSEPINHIALSLDGRLAAAVDDSGRLQVWDASTGAGVATVRHDGDPIRSFVFLSDGRSLVSSSDAGRLARWQPGTITPVWQRRLTARSEVNVLGTASDMVVVVEGHGGIRYVDASSGADRKHLLPERARRASVEGQRVSTAALSQDQKHIAIGYEDGQIWVLNPADGKGRWLTRPHTAQVERFAFAPDGGQMASVAADNSVIVWSRDDWSQSGSSLHGDDVYSVAFSPDSTRLATGSGDRTAVLRDDKGAPLITLRGHTDAAFAWHSHRMERRSPPAPGTERFGCGGSFVRVTTCT